MAQSFWNKKVKVSNPPQCSWIWSFTFKVQVWCWKLIWKHSDLNSCLSLLGHFCCWQMVKNLCSKEVLLVLFVFLISSLEVGRSWRTQSIADKTSAFCSVLYRDFDRNGIYVQADVFALSNVECSDRECNVIKWKIEERQKTAPVLSTEVSLILAVMSRLDLGLFYIHILKNSAK